MLSMKGGTGYCYFVVLALSLVYLCKAEHRRRTGELYRAHRLFVFGLLGLPVIVLFQILVPRTGTFPELDPLLRLALVVPSLFFLASLSSRQLRLVQWGFVLGALGSGAWAVYAVFHPAVGFAGGRLGNSFTNPIPFGDTALLLGFLSIASIERQRYVPVAEVAIKVVALSAGCYTSYLSGSRGGWIAVPILIWATASGRHWGGVRERLALALVVLACFAAVASTSVVRERFGAIGTDVQKMGEGNLDTSTGLRIDLWRASVLLYERHPLLGVGRGSLESALANLANNGEAPRAIVNRRGHSDFFSTLAEMGTVGVAALLLLYFAALRPFWQNRHSTDPDIATASYLGLALVGSTILFGLTIDVLALVMNAAFFALTAATLLAWIEARKRELTSDAQPAQTRAGRNPFS
jgi:O-antigen ligase